MKKDIIVIILGLLFLLAGLIMLVDIARAEINQEGVIGKMSAFESTYPDIVDNGIGWTIVNTVRNGIPTQILIQTPGYVPPAKPDVVGEELRKIRELLDK